MTNDCYSRGFYVLFQRGTSYKRDAHAMDMGWSPHYSFWSPGQDMKQYGVKQTDCDQHVPFRCHAMSIQNAQYKANPSTIHISEMTRGHAEEMVVQTGYSWHQKDVNVIP